MTIISIDKQRIEEAFKETHNRYNTEETEKALVFLWHAAGFSNSKSPSKKDIEWFNKLVNERQVIGKNDD